MKVPKGLSRIEQETFFRTSAADSEWDFYTRDPKFKRLLEKRGYEVREDHQGLWSSKLPREALTVRRNEPRVSRRKLTAAQQRALQAGREGRFKSKSLDADPDISRLDLPDAIPVGGG